MVAGMKPRFFRSLILTVSLLCASCAGPAGPAVPFKARLVTNDGTVAYSSKGGIEVVVDQRSGK